MVQWHSMDANTCSRWGRSGVALTAASNPVTAARPCTTQPLHVAALVGCSEAVSALLAAGAPVGARSARGWSALEEALAGRHADAAGLLLVRVHWGPVAMPVSEMRGTSTPCMYIPPPVFDLEHRLKLDL